MMIEIDVVSDAICPWCYIGKRRLEQAITAVSGTHEVRVRWKPFQLNPSMPPEGMDRKTYRLTKFGSEETVRKLDQRVIEAGKSVGLTLAMDKIGRTPNTLDAHRLIWFAGSQGVQDALVERLFRAFFTEGRDIGDRETLVDLAADAGLDREAARKLLGSTRGLQEVRKEEEEARSRYIEAVPTFTIAGRYVVSGAHEPDVFLEAFEAAATGS
jgi:predicted DsbA family dithiol-disulfide isomerase